ncbi:hypothetical protein [Streptomyces sp. NPDC005385]|uniref:hypothetical protein n=1 Tax=Streptomyces sp. NPDC005385 TaxID=3157039 RepID=UPI0033AE0696
MIAFAALVGLVVLFLVSGHDRVKVALAAVAVALIMGGPQVFMNDVVDLLTHLN